MSSATDPLEGLGGGRRPPWSVFRSTLEEAGFRPSKTLGQNFLVDPNAARSIALDAGLPRGARVLEVGAGCGFLTLHLSELGFEVLAVEIDARLLEVARRLLADRPGLTWQRADALASKHTLSPEVRARLPESGPWHLVSNLPYSISAPLVAVLSRLPNPPRSMTVLVQEEVAERLTAQPGEEAWGALSARLGILYRSRPGRPVGAQLFWPRPRVASRVAHLQLQPLEPLGAGEIEDYDALVEALFQHRRKQLVGGLADRLGRPAAEALVRGAGLDPRTRPEVLGPAQLLQLARGPEWRLRRRAPEIG